MGEGERNRKKERERDDMIVCTCTTFIYARNQGMFVTMATEVH